MTITETRYQGVYEGGKWAAFNMWPHEIPADAFGSDTECAAWWDEHGAGVGVGDTPQEAHDALLIIPVQTTWRAVNRRSGRRVIVANSQEITRLVYSSTVPELRALYRFIATLDWVNNEHSRLKDDEDEDLRTTIYVEGTPIGDRWWWANEKWGLHPQDDSWLPKPEDCLGDEEESGGVEEDREDWDELPEHEAHVASDELHDDYSERSSP